MSGQQPQRSGKSATADNQIHPKYTADRDALAVFRQWCIDSDVVIPALALNQWVRTNSPGKRVCNRSLAAIQKSDCILVHDHTTCQTQLFTDGKPQSEAERLQQRTEIRRHQEAEKKRRQAKQAVAATGALQAWQEAIEAPVSGYMASKGLTSTHGARWHQRLNCWLILITDVRGNVYSVQRIFNNPPPNKFHWKGARTAGGMVIIGDIPTATRVQVCEGFATGGTLRQETGDTVVCALFADNLLAVCQAIRSAYPDINIIVCGDDDRGTESNPGRKKAIEAAMAVNAKLVMPQLCDGCKCTDFNDQANCEQGARNDEYC